MDILTFIKMDNERHALLDAERKTKQSPPQNVICYKNISYLKDGKTAHLLDIYSPKDVKEKLPVLVDIHGGGWVYGNKELNEYYCMSLAKLGFIVFNINYTLVPEVDLKGQIQDIAEALNWVFDHAGEYNGEHMSINEERKLCLAGDSAGGYLALMLCAAIVNDEYRKIYELPKLNGTICGLGLTCPVPCIHERIEGENGRESLMKRERTRLLYGPKGTKIEETLFWKFSDPKDFVPECTLPPIYLLTLPEDTAYYWESVRFHQILEQYQVSHIYRVWKSLGEDKLGHVFNVLYPEYEDSQKVNSEMAEFFKNSYN